MKKFVIYLQLQIKRMQKVCLPIFLMTAGLAAGFGLLIWMQYIRSEEEPGKQKISLGVVGDMNDSYLGFGISALENLDSSRYTLQLLPLEEKEAKSRLEQGAISAYLVIPDGFVDSIVNGENARVTYVVGGGQRGIGTQLAQELSEAISTLITESETGIYSMVDIYRNHGLRDRVYEDMDQLNLRYFDRILAREKMYRVEQLDGNYGISSLGYYLCAALVVFLLLWGVNGSSLLIHQDYAWERVLLARGIPVWAQSCGEFLAYLLLFAVNMAGILGLVFLGIRGRTFPLPEISGSRDLILFVLAAWPVLLMTAAFQYVLYMLADGLISGILLHFTVSLVLGYLSGCFYPLSFFPEILQKIGAVLPTGIAMEYLQRILLGKSAGYPCLELTGYSCLFFGLAVLVKKVRIRHR